MLIDSREVKFQFTENLQKLLEFVINRFSGFPVIFVDKKEYEETWGIPFRNGGVACAFRDTDKLVIALK